jgi:AraC-like DNA-binding protein
LPGRAPVLSLRLRGNISYQHLDAGALPLYALSGLRKAPRSIQYEAGAASLLILFRECGINSFFNTPAHELFNDSVSLSDLVQPYEIALLEDRLGNAADNPACIAVIESFLLQRLQQPVTDALIVAALQQIKLCQGNLSVTALASSLFISQDAFEKRFRKAVGTTSKHFASLIRMQSIVRQRPSSPNFTTLALEAGYFDQSHFNKAFKQFTGLTPSSFFKRPPQW